MYPEMHGMCNRLSMGMNKQFHPTHCNGCNYLSMQTYDPPNVNKVATRNASKQKDNITVKQRETIRIWHVIKNRSRIDSMAGSRV